MPRRSTRRRFRDLVETEGEATRGATEEARRFDPREAAREAGRAQFADIREDLTEDFETLQGRQASAGKLRTGFGFRNQDRFIRDRLDRLDRAFARNALTSSGQELSRLGLISRQRGRFGDLLSGELDRQTADENARRQRRAQLIGSVARLGGSVVPFL